MTVFEGDTSSPSTARILNITSCIINIIEDIELTNSKVNINASTGYTRIEAGWILTGEAIAGDTAGALRVNADDHLIISHGLGYGSSAGEVPLLDIDTVLDSEILSSGNLNETPWVLKDQVYKACSTINNKVSIDINTAAIAALAARVTTLEGHH